MKKIKIAFAVLAVVFAVSSAFTTQNSQKTIKVGERTLSQQWFDYTGTNPLLESSYTYRSSGAPSCNSNFKPCAIEILADESTHDIDNIAFSNLTSQSSNFTVAGSYTDGVFREKPQFP